MEAIACSRFWLVAEAASACTVFFVLKWNFQGTVTHPGISEKDHLLLLIANNSSAPGILLAPYSISETSLLPQLYCLQKSNFFYLWHCFRLLVFVLSGILRTSCLVDSVAVMLYKWLSGLFNDLSMTCYRDCGRYCLYSNDYCVIFICNCASLLVVNLLCCCARRLCWVGNLSMIILQITDIILQITDDFHWHCWLPTTYYWTVL